MATPKKSVVAFYGRELSRFSTRKCETLFPMYVRLDRRQAVSAMQIYEKFRKIQRSMCELSYKNIFCGLKLR